MTVLKIAFIQIQYIEVCVAQNGCKYSFLIRLNRYYGVSLKYRVLIKIE